MEYRVNKPYPKIEVERPNKKYAKLLLEDYAGISGEDTAIHQYSFQHFDKFNVSKDFADTLAKIAAVEMRHLELLGETIKLLGLNPKFKFTERNCHYLTYFSSSFVNYETDIRNMLLSDIEIEEKAIKNYLYHISIINDKYVKRLLYRIIEDEQVHIKCFKELLKMV